MAYFASVADMVGGTPLLELARFGAERGLGVKQQHRSVLRSAFRRRGVLDDLDPVRRSALLVVQPGFAGGVGCGRGWSDRLHTIYIVT